MKSVLILILIPLMMMMIMMMMMMMIIIIIMIIIIMPITIVINTNIAKSCMIQFFLLFKRKVCLKHEHLVASSVSGVIFFIRKVKLFKFFTKIFQRWLLLTAWYVQQRVEEPSPNWIPIPAIFFKERIHNQNKDEATTRQEKNSPRNECSQMIG